MNRNELVAALAERTSLSRTDAAEVVRHLFHPENGLISSELRSSGRFTLTGFGTFERKTMAARTVRNPRTGKEIDLPERSACRFRSGAGLRKSMKDIVGG